MKKIMTPEEIMTRVANDHSYETWGEMMYDTHECSQIEYTKEAMIIYADQFKNREIPTVPPEDRTNFNEEDMHSDFFGQNIKRAYNTLFKKK